MTLASRVMSEGRSGPLWELARSGRKNHHAERPDEAVVVTLLEQARLDCRALALGQIGINLDHYLELALFERA